MRRPLALALVLAAPAAAAAQAPLGFTLGAGASWERARTQPGAGENHELLSGATIAGEGTLRRGRLLLRLRYAQGRLSADTGTAFGRRLVEGEALLGVEALPWLTVWAGPHARTYTTSVSRQRWWFWELRGRGRGTLIADRLACWIEAGVAVGASIQVKKPFDRQAAGEAGLLVRVAAPDVWGRLGYRIEQSRLDGGRRLETVEAVSFGVLFELR